MAAAVIFAVVCFIVFRHSGRKLKEKLKKEYGENV